MLKSVIVSAVIGAAALAGGQYAATGAMPFTAPAAIVSAPATAAQLPTVVAVSPVGACGPQTNPQAAAEAPQTDAPTAAASSGGVNLNTATAAELEALPGIGAKTAARIIASRPIAKVEDVAAMPGVSGPNFALFKSRVTV